jgi:hypothetical protein
MAANSQGNRWSGSGRANYQNDFILKKTLDLVPILKRILTHSNMYYLDTRSLRLANLLVSAILDCFFAIGRCVWNYGLQSL